jgi:hypothetical protein
VSVVVTVDEDAAAGIHSLVAGHRGVSTVTGPFSDSPPAARCAAGSSSTCATPSPTVARKRAARRSDRGSDAIASSGASDRGAWARFGKPSSSSRFVAAWR